MPARFIVPESYVRLHRAGRFDYWGAPYRSLTKEQRAQLIEPRELLVLWWSPIEWERDLTPEAIASFVGNDILRPGLIPFAGNGTGDQFCWYPPWQTGADIPVVLFVHDELQSALFARSFEECLVRCMLEHFADRDDGDDTRAKTVWDAHLAILGEVLATERIEMLTALGGSRVACAEAEARIASEVGTRKLVGALQPTKYREDLIKAKATLLRLYDQSIEFYRDLVEREGRTEFEARLAETRANRERVAKRTK